MRRAVRYWDTQQGRTVCTAASPAVLNSSAGR